MYGVDLYRRVRLACHREGLSRREASRQFGIDRKTVAKILLHSEPPGYWRRQPPKRPKLAPRRHRLRRGRGGQQDPGDPAHEALRHALADRRRTSCADLPRPDQIRSLRPGMEGQHRRNRHTGQRQHQSLCRHRHRCLNSMNEATAINAIRDSHPLTPTFCAR